MKNARRILVGKPQGKLPRGRLAHRWNNIIKMDLKDVGRNSVKRFEMAQDGGPMGGRLL
jgi:hypothetical protein